MKFQIIHTYQAICFSCKKESDFLYQKGDRTFECTDAKSPAGWMNAKYRINQGANQIATEGNICLCNECYPKIECKCEQLWDTRNCPEKIHYFNRKIEVD